MPQADLESGRGVGRTGQEGAPIPMNNLNGSPFKQRIPDTLHPIYLAPQETGTTNSNIISPVQEPSEYSKAQYEQHPFNGVEPQMHVPTTRPDRPMGTSWAEHRRKCLCGVAILGGMIVIVIIVLAIVGYVNHKKHRDSATSIQPMPPLHAISSLI